MSCAPPKNAPELGQRAYSTRLALYAAAGLDVADKVRRPDQRFAEAVEKLGREHPLVRAAIADRNTLAGLAEPLVRAIAASYAQALPSLSRDEALQEGRAAALRAAEMWSPGGGASFTGYSRKWIKKRVSQLADRARAVSRPERARLAGEPIDLVAFNAEVHPHARDPFEDLEARADLEIEAERLDRAVAELPALEREVLLAELDRSGSQSAAATGLGLRACDYAAALERALGRLRHDFAGGPPPAPDQLALFGL